jgi:iron(III) transport system ATP-binding protein
MYKVTLNGISKKFGKVEVLKKIQAEILEGEMFFLLGPSGCGKTTLLRILAGFETPDQGSVFFNEKDATKIPPQKRNTSLVFQSYALWPHMTVFENIAFGLTNRKMKTSLIKEKVNKILSLVHMEGFEKRSPNQLSGGQQQRVALARALVVEPEFLLLDEPLSNLDAKLRLEMRIELQRLHRETGVTTVYVTHDQEEALSMADRIAFLDQGNLIQVGTPRQLYQTPVNTTTARFLGHANLIEGNILQINPSFVDVQTRLGVLTGIYEGKELLAKNQKVYCFFRPENMTQGKTERNSIAGKVHSGLYVGNKEHLYLEYQGCDFQALLAAPEEPTKAGSEMSFEISPKDVRILLS